MTGKSGRRDFINKLARRSKFGGARNGSPSSPTQPRILSQDSADPVIPLQGSHALHRRQGFRQAQSPGFLTATLLADGLEGGRKGFPIQLLTQVSTATTGGRSNTFAIAPFRSSSSIFNPSPSSNFTDNIIKPPARPSPDIPPDSQTLALTESDVGLVQIWRLDGLRDMPHDAPVVALANQPGMLPEVLVKLRVTIVAEWRAPATLEGINGYTGTTGTDVNAARGWTVALAEGEEIAGSRNQTKQERRMRKRQTNVVLGVPVDGKQTVAPQAKRCCSHVVWVD